MSGINIERKSKWVHSCGVIKQVFEVISSTSTQVVYRDIDGYGQSTMLPFDFLQTFKPAPVVDDTFNDDTPAQTFCDIEFHEGKKYMTRVPNLWRRDEKKVGISSKMRLIGIHGPARAGKDTLASYLLDNLSDDWSRSSFAGPIKAMIEVITGEVKDEDKDKVDPRFGVTVRYLYQTIGTDWGRDMVGGDIWVGAFSRLNAGEQLVVPDVRFENEAELVRANGVLIHLVGRGGIDGNHVSENAIEFKPGDIVIDNSRDMAWLMSQVDGNAVLSDFIAEASA